MLQLLPDHMAAPKTEKNTASAVSRAGPGAGHSTARKVILVIVGPDVMQHTAGVHLAPIRLPTADWHVVGPSPRRRPHNERREPVLNEAENVPHVFAALTQWNHEAVLRDVPSDQRSRMHGASNFSAVRGVMLGLRKILLRRIFREQHTPAIARSADQGAT